MMNKYDEVENKWPEITKQMVNQFQKIAKMPIPEDVQRETQRIFLDTIGCLVGGAQSPIGIMTHRLIKFFGKDDHSSIPGLATRRSLFSALYANGRMANAMDFDETFPVGAHFGTAAVISALALGEYKNASPDLLLRSVLAGYEFGARVAVAVGPMLCENEDGELGYPNVWGVAAPVVMAALGASAILLELNPTQWKNAIGLAANQTPIPTGQRWSSAVNLPDCKYCDAGWATLAGTFAAVMASEGATGYDDILDGPTGFFRMCQVEKPNLSALSRSLEECWYIRDVTYKFWPSCRFTHYPLTAFNKLLKSENLQPEEIEEIEILTSPLANSERFKKRNPIGFIERQYSYPHIFSAAALRIPPHKWLNDTDAKKIDASGIKELIKISLHPESLNLLDCIDAGLLKAIPGGVRMKARGTVFEAHSEIALGDPWSNETFATDDMLIEKFKNLTGRKGEAFSSKMLDTNFLLTPSEIGDFLRGASV